MQATTGTIIATAPIKCQHHRYEILQISGSLYYVICYFIKWQHHKDEILQISRNLSYVIWYFTKCQHHKDEICPMWFDKDEILQICYFTYTLFMICDEIEYHVIVFTLLLSKIIILYFICEHQIIHYTNILCFSWGRTNLWKLNVAKMDGRDSPYSSNAKIKLLASVVAKKKKFFHHHLYEHLKLGRW